MSAEQPGPLPDDAGGTPGAGPGPGDGGRVPGAARPGTGNGGRVPDDAVRGPDDAGARRARTRASVRNRVIGWTLVAVVLVLLALLAASAVPRWWAQSMGNLSDGGLGRSIWWGLAFGFVFTLLPTVVIAKSVRRWKGWKAPLVWLVVAVVLAAPNLFTLWIVVGTTRAAHAAERTLDVSAPYFAASSAWGAALGLVVGVGAELLWRSWRRRGRKLQELREGGTPHGVTPPGDR